MGTPLVAILTFDVALTSLREIRNHGLLQSHFAQGGCGGKCPDCAGLRPRIWSGMDADAKEVKALGGRWANVPDSELGRRDRQRSDRRVRPGLVLLEMGDTGLEPVTSGV